MFGGNINGVSLRKHNDVLYLFKSVYRRRKQRDNNKEKGKEKLVLSSFNMASRFQIYLARLFVDINKNKLLLCRLQ